MRWSRRLPGYNHYSWCTCGWCFNNRSGAYARPVPPERARAVNDTVFLSTHRVSATRSVACFVNANAICPICGEPVFYYQNAFGSKVYFDDLGWPWPKHYCTDNRRLRRGTRGAVTFLTTCEAAIPSRAYCRQPVGRTWYSTELLIAMAGY